MGFGQDRGFSFLKPLGKTQSWDNEGLILSSPKQGNQPRMLELGINSKSLISSF